VCAMYFVRSGAIALERPMADGTALTLHLALEGMALAEASLFTEFYHCDAVARAPSTIATLPRSNFLTALRKSPDAALSLIEAQSKEVQGQRARIEILRLRRVSDKLDAWLDLYGEPARGDWVKVAEAIGVSQPALYRELAKRRG
jgi:CRP-like cAMP-binding protein